MQLKLNTLMAVTITMVINHFNKKASHFREVYLEKSCKNIFKIQIFLLYL